MEIELRYSKVGENVLIIDDLDSYPHVTKKHSVLSVEENPYNNIVPYSFETCCGKYIPTSAADGHWDKDTFRTGGWDIENQETLT